MTTSQQRLSREQINIRREVDYIVRRAAERDVRIVTLGSLVFFSTESGDAWLLDPATSWRSAWRATAIRNPLISSDQSGVLQSTGR